MGATARKGHHDTQAQRNIHGHMDIRDLFIDVVFIGDVIFIHPTLQIIFGNEDFVRDWEDNPSALSYQASSRRLVMQWIKHQRCEQKVGSPKSQGM